MKNIKIHWYLQLYIFLRSKNINIIKNHDCDKDDHFDVKLLKSSNFVLNTLNTAPIKIDSHRTAISSDNDFVWHLKKILQIISVKMFHKSFQTN